MTLTIPHQLMFGYWGAAVTPWLMILSSKHKDNAALIAHEKCHQEQQRIDGTFTFWYRYITKRSFRLSYELEAYKVWLKISPKDAYMVSLWLANNYNLGLSFDKAVDLLSES